MKIGILTIYVADNYGAIFQALASKYFLESLGHKAYIIDYWGNKKFSIPFFLKGLHFVANIKFCILQILRYPFVRRRYNIFLRFIKGYIYKCANDWDSQQNDFDCFYVGSDQVWNPSYINKYIPIFFCQFSGADNKKCISYAASMGINYIPEHLRSELLLYLKRFSAISVREETTKTLISPLVDIPVEVTIDPTFLLTKEQWLRLFPGEKTKSQQPYIVVFEVRHSELTTMVAELVSKKYNCVIKRIPSGIDLRDKGTWNTIEPFDFISIIANARFVVTTSFHGTAFSLICRVPFYSIATNENDNRLKDLLNSCDAIDRLIDKLPIEIDNRLNWDNITKKLEARIKSSQDFLKRSLQD